MLSVRLCAILIVFLALVGSAQAFALRMGPPLPPAPLGVVRPRDDNASTKQPQVRVEIYADLACPFAGRLFQTVHKSVAPQYDDRVEWVLHMVPQPWHPQSPVMIEAALAVKHVKPEAYWAFCDAVWSVRQQQFIDDVTMDTTRNQLYDTLADIAHKVGADRAAVRQKLTLKGTDNTGTHVIQDLKWAVQHHRKRGVHVTPTVFVNGIEAVDVSSSFTADQWKEFLDGFLKA